MHRPTTRALVGTATQPELVFRRSYRATPADVMQACTDPERLARWFGAIHGTAVAVGDRFAVDLGGGEADTATCQVLRCEEDSVSVSWAWQDEPLSTLTARLRSDGDGLTELTLHHALAQPDHLAGYSGGWEQLLQSLARSLDDAAPDSPEDATSGSSPTAPALACTCVTAGRGPRARRRPRATARGGRSPSVSSPPSSPTASRTAASRRSEASSRLDLHLT
ncbi:SRPBCC domain-containing protein [Salana multivorans]